MGDQGRSVDNSAGWLFPPALPSGVLWAVAFVAVGVASCRRAPLTEPAVAGFVGGIPGDGGPGGTGGTGETAGSIGSGGTGGSAATPGSGGPGGTGGTGETAGSIGSGGTGGSCSPGGSGVGGQGANQCGFTMPNPASTGLPNPTSYTRNPDGTVTDNVTGLIWGDADAGRYTPAQAVLHCASQGDGWHLPTRLELVSLVDFTISHLVGPSINQTYFPKVTADYFWTSTPYVGFYGSLLSPVNTRGGWEVSMIEGDVTFFDVSFPERVICVRTPSPRCYSTRYQVEAGGLVHDRTTGLTWQQNVSPGTYNLAYAASDANAYCSALGAGWRLPSVSELQTIVDDTKVCPAIDVTAFPTAPGPGTLTLMTLTSSRAGDGTATAWYVDFLYGAAHVIPADVEGHVRCVR